MHALRFDIRAQGPFACHYQAEFSGLGIHFLWGNSGAGKTTLLHMLAGLTPCKGEIYLQDEPWQTEKLCVPAQQRDISLVFQKDTLFPFLSVCDNLLFGYRNAVQKRFTPEQVIADLDIGPLLHKSVRDLSGGERQRVQLGRALLNQPRWLFLDEAFAALDQQSRQRMFALLRDIVARYQIPVVMISHQWQEVLQLADYVHQVVAGSIHSSAAFAQAIADDKLLPDAQYSVLQFSEVHWDEKLGLFCADAGGQRILLPHMQAGANRVVIQARDVAIALQKPEHTSILNAWPAKVLGLQSVSDHQVNVQLEVAGQYLHSQISRYSCQILNLQKGMQVYALVKGVALLR
ncbi:MAG: molybdenum ABC transporter ATP-binding protein [Oceanospirillaceae bacterium]|nr:molybdenum ABC transporter ATP-binding protein [Oceanospirillaceae bacterium]MCP5349773.1 molybdenum ABC transporter ATP-binding protein [Oceanospirillaceae bacterium]